MACACKTNKDGAVASPGVSAPDQPGHWECWRAAAGLDLGLNLGFKTQTRAYSTCAQCPMFLSSVIFKNCLKVHEAYVFLPRTGGASVAPAGLTCPVLYTPSVTKVPGTILQPWFSNWLFWAFSLSEIYHVSGTLAYLSVVCWKNLFIFSVTQNQQGKQFSPALSFILRCPSWNEVVLKQK